MELRGEIPHTHPQTQRQTRNKCVSVRKQMINTRNLKDIGKLNVYEIVRELKGVRQKKKYIDVYMLYHITFHGVPGLSVTVITALGLL